MEKRKAALITFFCIVATLLTYLFVGYVKVLPSGDETISYLCASGQQEAYQLVGAKSSLYGKWTDAQDWKDFFTSRPGRFRNIAPDLSKSDLHPPLYFWLLHFFSMLPLAAFKGGLVLNFILHLLSFFVLSRICGQLRVSFSARTFVLLAFTLSPAIIGTGFHARQYELLGLMNLLTLSAFIQYRNSQKPLHLFVMIISLTLGMLTQYLFIYFAFAYAGFALVVERNVKVCFILAGVIVLALLLVMLIHPGIFNQFALQQQRTQQFEMAQLATRTGKTILAFVQVLFPVLGFKMLWLALPETITILVSGTILVLFSMLIYRSRASLLAGSRSGIPPLIMWLLGCAVLLAVLPYLFFLTPMHAMGGPYLVLVYPFLLLAAGIFFSEKGKLLQGAVILMAAGCLLLLTMLFYQQKMYEPLIKDIENSDVVIVNTVNRRGFLRLVPFLAHQKVMMDEQAVLCNQQALFIADEYTKPETDLPCNTYDLTDGVVFYVWKCNKP